MCTLWNSCRWNYWNRLEWWSEKTFGICSSTFEFTECHLSWWAYLQKIERGQWERRGEIARERERERILHYSIILWSQFVETVTLNLLIGSFMSEELISSGTCARTWYLYMYVVSASLDATGSLELLSHLNKLAESNCTVILTIHQPRLEIFHMLHQLVLLSDGKVHSLTTMKYSECMYYWLHCFRYPTMMFQIGLTRHMSVLWHQNFWNEILFLR